MLDAGCNPLELFLVGLFKLLNLLFSILVYLFDLLFQNYDLSSQVQLKVSGFHFLLLQFDLELLFLESQLASLNLCFTLSLELPGLLGTRRRRAYVVMS